MPITSREEKLIWLLLSACWAVGGFIGWLASLLVDSEPVSLGVLFLASILIAAISLALRLPILTDTPHGDQLSDHLAVLLGYAAAINWGGCLVLHASTLAQAVLALLVIILGEIWIHCQFYFDDCLTWFRFRPRFGSECESERSDIEWADIGGDEDSRPLCIDDDPSERTVPHSQSAIDSRTVRTSVEGLNADGHRYLSGEIRLEFSPRQTDEDVVIGFCPAFNGEPEVDFELTDERVSARLLHCTPAGMKLSVRRASGRSKETEDLSFELHWYALQLGEEDLAARQKERVLP